MIRSPAARSDGSDLTRCYALRPPTSGQNGCPPSAIRFVAKERHLLTITSGCAFSRPRSSPTYLGVADRHVFVDGRKFLTQRLRQVFRRVIDSALFDAAAKPTPADIVAKASGGKFTPRPGPAIRYKHPKGLNRSVAGD